MNSNFLKRHGTLLAVCLITAIGASLRLYHLNYQSLWYDELHSIIPANPDNSLASIIEYSKSDQPPFFFIYLFYFFKLFGYDEVTGRVASAILGVISIPAIFLLGKEIKGTQVGMFAAGLTSLNFMHIYYSQELRFYTMLFLLTCMSFLFLIRAYKYSKTIDFILYIAVTISLLYTHYYGVLIFVVQTAIFPALLYYKRDKRFVSFSIASGALVAASFIPWLPVVFSDLSIETFWISRPETSFILSYFYYYFGKDAFASVVLGCFFALFLKEFFAKRHTRSSLYPLYIVLAGWLVFSYVIPFLMSVFGTPILYVRYTIISLPAWILILAIGWGLVINKKWKYGLVLALSLSMLINLFFFRKHYVKVDKQQMREVSNFVKTNNVGYPIYSLYAWQFGFYFRDDLIKPQSFRLADLPELDTFWLLHAHFFSAEEVNEVLSPLQGQFEIVRRASFYKTEALLVSRVASPLDSAGQ